MIGQPPCLRIILQTNRDIHLVCLEIPYQYFQEANAAHNAQSMWAHLSSFLPHNYRLPAGEIRKVRDALERLHSERITQVLNLVVEGNHNRAVQPEAAEAQAVEVRQVRQALDQVSRELDAQRGKARAAQRSLDSLKKEKELAEGRARDVEQHSLSLQAEILRLEKELSQVRKELDAQQERYERSVESFKQVQQRLEAAEKKLAAMPERESQDDSKKNAAVKRSSRPDAAD